MPPPVGGVDVGPSAWELEDALLVASGCWWADVVGKVE
jgi:hypothetical protein